MILELILASGSLSVVLPKTADVAGTDITLGEIAQLSGDAELVERAKELSLGYSPAPGFSRLLRADSVEAKLEALLPDVAVDFGGEPSCRVQPLVQTIDGAAVQALAREELGRIFEGLDVEIATDTTVVSLEVPRGEAPVRLVPVLQRRDTRPGAWSVPVQIVVDGNVYQTVWTRWTVGLWANRQVLARPVRRGERLTAADFRRTRVQLHAASSEAPLAPLAFEGAIARRDLGAGQPVAKSDVERPRVGQRGDLVHLEIRRGAVTAKMPVYLLEGGRIGDPVRVRTVTGSRELTASIVNKDLVRIHMQ